MNPQLVAIMAAIAAAQARIAGMQAANTVRESNGEALAYGEEEFFYEANYLDGLSIEARNAQMKVMLRHPDGPYKHGRSTAKEGWLLKVKRFEDSEARIIGFSELMHNANEAKRNELGHLERSSKKAGKQGAQVLGSFIVKDLKTGVEFDIGTGFTASQRQELWNVGDNLLGRIIKYKSQPTGVKDKPRFPVFLGFRDNRDL